MIYSKTLYIPLWKWKNMYAFQVTLTSKRARDKGETVNK